MIGISFKKGHVPWNKGKRGYSTSKRGFKISAETRERLRISHLGQKSWNKGTGKPKTGEEKAIYRRQHYLKNKAKYIFQANWRKERLKEKNLDPTADIGEIQKFYLLAEKLTNETGVKYAVDHIQPLFKGGKHHQDNLQVITALDNARKGYKYPFEIREKHLIT